MSKSQTTMLGIILGALVIALGALQPYIGHGPIDLKVVIPAVVLAIVMFLEKEGGSWMTTTVYSVIAAVGAAASTMIHNPTASWVVIILASLTALAGAITKDVSADGKPTGLDADVKQANAPPALTKN